ncbi:MAG: hypothetical protein ACOVMP_09205 [Chthoniobacterales bacterium]
MKTICQHNRRSDICYICNPIPSKPLSTGIRQCYAAFMTLYPWRKTELPTYEAWILSDDYAALIFRQGWAARESGSWETR